MTAKKTTKQSDRKPFVLPVHVTPRARKTEVIGLQADGRLRIRLKAMPEDGKANQALLEFLSHHAQVPVTHIHIVSGATSHDKLIRFDGVEPGEVMIRLLDAQG